MPPLESRSRLERSREGLLEGALSLATAAISLFEREPSLSLSSRARIEPAASSSRLLSFPSRSRSRMEKSASCEGWAASRLEGLGLSLSRDGVPEGLREPLDAVSIAATSCWLRAPSLFLSNSSNFPPRRAL